MLDSSYDKKQRKQRKKQGKTYQKQAVELVNGPGDGLREALPYFRASTRSNPNNAQYLNNLGVTEMRLGMFEKAKGRFLRVLNDLDPENEIAVENIEDLKKLVSEEEYVKMEPRDVNGEDLPQKHTVLPIPVIRYQDLINPENETAAKYVLGDTPYVLTGAMEDWELDTWSFYNLIENFGDSRVDYYPHNMRQATVKPFFSNVREALEQFSNPTGIFETVDASRPDAYIQWNVESRDWEKLRDEIGMNLPANFRTDDDWIAKCFGFDKVSDKFHHRTHWRMVLIGQTGAGMFNHKDTLNSASFQSQIRGRKRWHLCDDSQSEFLYGAGKVNTFAPDYEKFPLALEATCYDTVLNTGEMLYYPQAWWHQTVNLDDVTMAVSGTLVTKGNRPHITREFQKECNPDKNTTRIFTYEKDLCDALELCFDVWTQKDWLGDLRADFAKDEQNKLGRRTEL